MATNKVKQAPAKQVNAPPKQTEDVETTALAANVSSAQAGAMVAATAAPAWLQKHMQGNAPRGLDKMDNADIILPRLVLAQSQTPEVINGEENGYGITNGCLFDNLTKQVLAKPGEVLEIIPIILGKSRMYLQPFNEGGGILCRADDAVTARPGGIGKDEGNAPTNDCGTCVLKEFDEAKGKPECSLFYNVIVLLPSHGYAAYIWSTKHTGVKVVKRFLSTAKQVGVDLFALKFGLTTVTQKSDKFTWKNFDFKPLGFVDETEYARAEGFFKSLEGKSWTPDTTDIEATESEGTTVNAESDDTAAPIPF